MKVYFLHNLDGRRCGLIAAPSKRVVSKIAFVAESEIEEFADHPAAATARAAPLRLFVQDLGADGPWRLAHPPQHGEWWVVEDPETGQRTVAHCSLNLAAATGRELRWELMDQAVPLPLASRRPVRPVPLDDPA